MAYFDLEDYIPVNDRITAFWKGEVAQEVVGKIETEIYHLDDASVKNRMVVMKASVFIDDKLIATGFAKEREGLAGANKTAFIENCETSAIGRALANMGVLVSKNRASREEMDAVQSIEDTTKAVLAEIKALGMSVGGEEIKQEINEAWHECAGDPVRAHAFLAEIKEKYAVEEVASVV